MGRPPSNGGPTFRFNAVEVGEMEAVLQGHHYSVPPREVLDALAQRFSSSAERSGKVEVTWKQIWNWFQNRRYALRARAARASAPLQVNMPEMPQHDQSRNVPQAPQPQALHPKETRPQPQSQPSTTTTINNAASASRAASVSSAQSIGNNVPESSFLEFEAKSARDGAWYDVAYFLSHRAIESGDPEALVRFSGFGPEEDEWVNIRRHVRQRSLPCESSECVAVLPTDLILCFQEGKEQALYFDAHVLDAQRRRHDKRGCRCRFLVRYDHDQSEEIVPLRKICRRPETDYRLQQLHAVPLNFDTQRPIVETQSRNTLKVNATGTMMQKQLKPEAPVPTLVSVPAPDNAIQPSPVAASVANVTITTYETTVPSSAHVPTPASGPAPDNVTVPSAVSAPTNVTTTRTDETNVPPSMFHLMSPPALAPTIASVSAPDNVTPPSEVATPDNVTATTGEVPVSGPPALVPTMASAIPDEATVAPSAVATMGTGGTSMSSAVADSGKGTDVGE